MIEKALLGETESMAAAAPCARRPLLPHPDGNSGPAAGIADKCRYFVSIGAVEPGTQC